MLNAVPLSTAEGFGDHAERHVLCPVCKFNYTHLHSVRVHQRDRCDTISREGHDITNANRKGRRGSAVEVVMWCEEGHSFSVWFEFHKGNTSMFAVGTGKAPDDDDELWRD